MKSSNRLKSIVTQFGYEHKNLAGRIVRIKKSTDELNKILSNMTPKEKKDEEK